MPGPVSQSDTGPVDPIVETIYLSLQRAGVLDSDIERDNVIDAIEGAFEAHGTPANVLRCAFCGQEYPAGTPATKHQSLTDHIMQCEAHPLRKVIQERDKHINFICTIHDELVSFPELNMSNYSVDDVAELNAKTIELYALIGKYLGVKNDAAN